MLTIVRRGSTGMCAILNSKAYVQSVDTVIVYLSRLSIYCLILVTTNYV